MDVKIGDRWQSLLAGAVQSGRFTSPEDVVNEGLRLVAEQETTFQALRQKIDLSIARGGSNTAEDVTRAVEQRLAELDLDKRAA